MTRHDKTLTHGRTSTDGEVCLINSDTSLTSEAVYACVVIPNLVAPRIMRIGRSPDLISNFNSIQTRSRHVSRLFSGLWKEPATVDHRCYLLCSHRVQPSPSYHNDHSLELLRTTSYLLNICLLPMSTTHRLYISYVCKPIEGRLLQVPRTFPVRNMWIRQGIAQQGSTVPPCCFVRL